MKASHSFDLNLLDSMVDAAVAKHSGDSYFGEMKIQVDGMQLQLETMLSVITIETQIIFTMEKDFTEFKKNALRVQLMRQLMAHARLASFKHN